MTNRRHDTDRDQNWQREDERRSAERGSSGQHRDRPGHWDAGHDDDFDDTRSSPRPQRYDEGEERVAGRGHYGREPSRAPWGQESEQGSSNFSSRGGRGSTRSSGGSVGAPFTAGQDLSREDDDDRRRSNPEASDSSGRQSRHWSSRTYSGRVADRPTSGGDEFSTSRDSGSRATRRPYSGGGFGKSSGVGAERQGPYAGHGPKGYTRSDERIKEDISDRLMEDPDIDAREIEVAVSQGEVTLTGTVDTRDVKWHAECLCDDVPGVKEVQNNVRVQKRRASSDEEQTSSSSSPTGTANDQASSRSLSASSGKSSSSGGSPSSSPTVAGQRSAATGSSSSSRNHGGSSMGGSAG